MYQRKKRKVKSKDEFYNQWIVVVVIAQNLIAEMKRMNMNLPARVWIPFHTEAHHVVRIAYTESTVLNSRDRVCSLNLFSILICLSFFSPIRLPTLSILKLYSVIMYLHLLSQ